MPKNFKHSQLSLTKPPFLTQESFIDSCHSFSCAPTTPTGSAPAFHFYGFSAAKADIDILIANI